MTASFPTSVKTFTTKQDYVDTVLAADINSPQEEITAIESVLYGSITQETLKFSSTGATVLALHRDTNTSTDFMDLLMQFNDSNGDTQTYGKISSYLLDNTAGAVKGETVFYSAALGGLKEYMRLGSVGGSESVIFNAQSEDIDFRIESDGNTHMFYLGAATEAITVGSVTELATFGIDGQIDKIQLVVQGHSTQNADIFEVQKSDGTQCFAVGEEKIGFYATAPIALQTGVAATEAGIFAALVNLGLITA